MKVVISWHVYLLIKIGTGGLHIIQLYKLIFKLCCTQKYGSPKDLNVWKCIDVQNLNVYRSDQRIIHIKTLPYSYNVDSKLKYN